MKILPNWLRRGESADTQSPVATGASEGGSRATDLMRSTQARVLTIILATVGGAAYAENKANTDIDTEALKALSGRDVPVLVAGVGAKSAEVVTDAAVEKAKEVEEKDEGQKEKTPKKKSGASGGIMVADEAAADTTEEGKAATPTVVTTEEGKEVDGTTGATPVWNPEEETPEETAAGLIVQPKDPEPPDTETTAKTDKVEDEPPSDSATTKEKPAEVPEPMVTVMGVQMPLSLAGNEAGIAKFFESHRSEFVAYADDHEIGYFDPEDLIDYITDSLENEKVKFRTQELNDKTRKLEEKFRKQILGDQESSEDAQVSLIP